MIPWRFVCSKVHKYHILYHMLYRCVLKVQFYVKWCLCEKLKSIIFHTNTPFNMKLYFAEIIYNLFVSDNNFCPDICWWGASFQSVWTQVHEGAAGIYQPFPPLLPWWLFLCFISCRLLEPNETHWISRLLHHSRWVTDVEKYTACRAERIWDCGSLRMFSKPLFHHQILLTFRCWWVWGSW